MIYTTYKFPLGKNIDKKNKKHNESQKFNQGKQEKKQLIDKGKNQNKKIKINNKGKRERELRSRVKQFVTRGNVKNTTAYISQLFKSSRYIQIYTIKKYRHSRN